VPIGVQGEGLIQEGGREGEKRDVIQTGIKPSTGDRTKRLRETILRWELQLLAKRVERGRGIEEGEGARFDWGGERRGWAGGRSCKLVRLTNGVCTSRNGLSCLISDLSDQEQKKEWEGGEER